MSLQRLQLQSLMPQECKTGWPYTRKITLLAGCKEDVVLEAIRNGCLRARRVGRVTLISEEDAEVFIQNRR